MVDEVSSAGVQSGLLALVQHCAREAGFDQAGVASVAQPDVASERRFAAWVASGHAGEMEWLKRVNEEGELVRGDLRRSIPWARSVIVCAASYNVSEPRSTDAAEGTQGWIARYAWSGEPAAASDAPSRGSDYHDTLLLKLRRMEDLLKAGYPTMETRCYVDTGPMLERDLAARAGIGWIGKNTCVLNQQLGSWFLLGAIVTSLELEPQTAALAATDRCGSCTRCIDACPTEALLRPTEESPARQMDASRCIAYLTIEKKGSIPEALRASMGRQVFGCDICQDVCPWNRKAPVAATHSYREALVNPELDWLGEMDGPTFNRWFRGSPLERTRRKRVQRNVAIAMGNSGELRFVPQLEAWSAGEDEVLAESAAWALDRLQQEPGEAGESVTQDAPVSRSIEERNG